MYLNTKGVLYKAMQYKCKKYINSFYYLLLFLVIFFIFNYFIYLEHFFTFIIFVSSFVGLGTLIKYSQCIMNSYPNGKKDAAKIFNNTDFFSDNY